MPTLTLYHFSPIPYLHLCGLNPQLARRPFKASWMVSRPMRKWAAQHVMETHLVRASRLYCYRVRVPASTVRRKRKGVYFTLQSVAAKCVTRSR